MNIVIVGQGAIGLLWHSHLIKIPHVKVHFAPREHAKNEDDLPVTPFHYTYTAHNGFSEEVSAHIANHLIFAKADLIIYCVKSYQVQNAVSETLPLLSKHCVLLLCHNGMGTITPAKKTFRFQNTLLSMITTHGCLRTSKVHARHTGLGISDIGLTSGNISESTKSQIIETLNDALPKIVWHENIAQRQWLKLAINSVINPITAINHVKNGDVLNPQFKSLIDDLTLEIVEVAKSLGVDLSFESIKDTIITVAKNTSKNSSSMLCDVQAKQKTEIDYINGYICRVGNKNGISVPHNSELVQKIKSIENQY